MDDFAAMNKAYLEFFRDYVPVGYHEFLLLIFYLMKVDCWLNLDLLGENMCGSKGFASWDRRRDWMHSAYVGIQTTRGHEKSETSRSFLATCDTS